MRIEQLQYLAAVPRYGSLRRASEPLHVSVPALSEGITRLERELGVTLLDRQRSGARISAQGREILPAVMDVLDAVERLRAAAGHQSTERRLLRVGSAHPTGHHAVLDTIRGLGAEGHPFTVELCTLPEERILSGVAEGTLDVGLMTLHGQDEAPPHLAVTPIADGSPVVVVPPSHPLTGRDRVTAAELRDEPLMIIGSCIAHRRTTSEIFGVHPPTRVIAVDSAEHAALLAADGAGIALLPDYSVLDGPLLRCGAIAVRPLDDAVEVVRLVALHRRRPTLPAALRSFLDTVRHGHEASRGPARSRRGTPAKRGGRAAAGPLRAG